MKVNLYDNSGYLNIPGLLKLNIPFNFIVGGRACGKTYGALKYVVESGTKFMLMRRTQTQTDLINKSDFSPFKPVCRDLGIEINTEPLSKYNSKFIDNNGDIIGYTCALSTLANMRGFDASNVKLLIYDEFIPEKHERALKYEGSAFLNAYETINRNRDLDGKRPLQVLALANAFDIANPIFLELGLVGIVEKMKDTGRELYINREKGILIALPRSEKIMDKKSRTALYNLTEGSNYASMALKNDFVYNPSNNVKSLGLREFNPVVTVGEITIYKHKSKMMYYVSEHRTGNPPTFNTDEVDLKRFIRAYGIRFYRAYMANRFRFENLLTKSLFECYII